MFGTIKHIRTRFLAAKTTIQKGLRMGNGINCCIRLSITCNEALVLVFKVEDNQEINKNFKKYFDPQHFNGAFPTN